jgi:hypothetical protein
MRMSRADIEAQIKDIRARRSMNAVGSMDFEPFDPFAMAAEDGEKSNPKADLSPWINPGKLTDRERLDLVARIDAGEVASVRFWAYTFGDGGNQNKLHVTAKQVRQLGKSAGRGMAALDGHGAFLGGSPASSIAGEVFKGRADTVASGETKLALAHRITEPPAMKSVVRGSWKWFSVSFNADDFNFELLDEDGKPTEDWEAAVDYRVTPVGNVWLTHNAFVGDPAWLGSEFLARSQGGALPKELAAMPQGTEEKVKGAPPAAAASEGEVELRAQLAASQEKVKQLSAELAAEKDAHFGSVFDHAKAQGKVSEDEREMYALAASSKGVQFAAAQLAKRKPVVALQTIGEAPSATPPSTTPPAPSKAGPKHQSKAGAEMSDEEAEAEVKKYNLSRGGGGKKGK